MEISIYFWIGFHCLSFSCWPLIWAYFIKNHIKFLLKRQLYGVWCGYPWQWCLMFWFIIEFGKIKALEFLTGYVIEYSLSVDNIFVFILIFTYFAVKAEYQHRVLFWGILGALIMRAIFIFAGVALINRFHWIVLIFGGFLVYTGIHMLFQKETAVDPEKNVIVKFFKKFLPVSDSYHGDQFFIKQNNKLFATPLFLVLLVIESSDLIFAVDSIPAILAISKDSFIVYTSNIFAIMGLRSLYFAISGIMGYFRFLKVGLAFVLSFVGSKMLLAFFGLEIHIVVSLLLIIMILAISILVSVLIKPDNKPV